MHGDYLIYSNLMHLIYLNPTMGTVLHVILRVEYKIKFFSIPKIQGLNKNTGCRLQQSIEKPKRKRGFLDQQRKL